MANKINLTFCSLLLFLIAPVLVTGQSKNDITVVGKVGGEKITYAELKENYTSGNSTAPTLAELEDFLPIYLDYKAKLLAAKDEGYYQDSALIAEHESYAKQAAYAFWLQKEIKPTVFNEYYNRALIELKPYHILIAVGQNANEHEINNAIEQLKLAKAEIEDGMPLDEVNEKYSSVRRGQSMGGDIPWISAGRTVKEFEDVVYKLEIGEISEPFRTQFGYHIVLLQDKRERTPARLTSHIFVRETDDTTSYDKIHEAYESLEEGQQWDQVIRKYSEDGNSIRNNGKIGWVSYQGNIAMDFVDVVVEVDPSLPYSEPVKTQYGYHIFKIDSVQTYPSGEARKEALMAELEKTPYYEESNRFVMDYLEKKFNGQSMSEVVDGYKEWLTSQDSTLLHDVSASPFTQNVYEFNGITYSVGDFHSYLQKNHSNSKAMNYRNAWFHDFTDHVIESNLIDLTVQNYPEFKKQVESYLNGLVVYNINEDNLWSSATVDTSRLRTLYKNQPQKYQYPERPYYYIISSRQDSVLDKAIEFVKNGGSPDSLRLHLNPLSIASDSSSGFEQAYFEQLKNMEVHTFSEKFNRNNTRSVLWLEDVLPARKMTFDESFNQLLGEFQPIREQEWLDELRNRYKVSPNFKRLRKAAQKDS